MEFVCRHLGDRARYGELDAMFRRGQERLTSGAAQRVADREQRVADAKRQLAARRNSSARPSERRVNESPAAVRTRIAEIRKQIESPDKAKLLETAHKDSRWATALHESGHVVACYRNGCRFRTVTITPGVNRDGSRYGGRVDTVSYDECCPSHVAAMALMGSFAQSYGERGECHRRYMSAPDRLIVDQQTARWPEVDRARFMAATEHTAKTFVEQNWQSIVLVARHLIVEGTLGVHQIEALLK
jgi:hypothetical protein